MAKRTEDFALPMLNHWLKHRGSEDGWDCTFGDLAGLPENWAVEIRIYKPENSGMSYRTTSTLEMMADRSADA